MHTNGKNGAQARVGALATSGAFWRRLAYAGARYGPGPWLRYSPPIFGLAFAAVLGKERRVVRDNLRRVLGRRSGLEEHIDIARTFASYAGCLAEALASERPEVRSARRRFRDGTNFRRLLAPNRGLIVATAHVGAWDVAAPLLAHDLDAPVLIAMEPERDAEARRLHDSVRSRSGVRVVHVGNHPLDALPLLHHLRDGGVVAVQMDRVGPNGRALEVELFGEPFSMPEGPFWLASLSKAPILPLFVRRVGHLDYEFSAGSLVHLPARPDAAELRSAADALTREMERFIRAHPTQWFRFTTGARFTSGSVET